MSSLPPLVSVPGSSTGAAASDSLEVSDRYSRSVRLPGFGLDAQSRLLAARVLVVGAGGLGAPVIEYLAASGVGTLGIVDDDVVDLSNLQRQVLFRPDQVGVPKARAAAEWVRSSAPDVRVVVHPVRLGADSAALLDDYDLVVDGSDSFDTCYVVADEAAARGLPVVWGSVNRFDGQLSVFWDDAPDGRAVDYRDLHPAPPAAGWDESCADVGVLGPLCGTVGTAMATEAVKLLTGVGEPLLGRVVTIDALDATWRESRLARAPHRAEARATANGLRRASSAPASVPDSASEASTAPDSAAVAVGNSGAEAAERRSARSEVAAPELSTMLQAREAGGADFTLLDVREVDEHAFAHIDGDVQAPGYGTRTRQRPELDRSLPVVVYCARGPRARSAAELLARDGFDVTVLHGGMLGWQLAQQGATAG
ncbi:ThiF family adenylyltransferase [Frigoribacterium sp. CFBP 13712]|uniref:ThiF family adenylyltransferase n=1 Tax=Frigoribacterium sp. CFBP 13712 TaxID=2775309 RepID=UPI00177F008F|nr:ThiF family adenylyltransferase [Frigoribacterium sp. CFBP 13712]MBD8702947.1 ThiF family adenylyltransferase [Frigoribacterium sp. CFBP 13712]